MSKHSIWPADTGAAPTPSDDVTAYLQQVARAYRFLDRYKAARGGDIFVNPNVINDVEDSLWAFFQNCWHIKDWLRHDDNIPQPTRDAIWLAAKDSVVLQVVADLANGSKHLARDPDKEWVGAAPSTVEIFPHQAGQGITHWIGLNDGTRLTALEVAERAMAEWQNILAAHGLPYFSEPTGA